MYKHILIPTDGSDFSSKAVLQGSALARAIDARVTIMTASPTFQTFAPDPFMAVTTPEQMRQFCRSDALEVLARAAETARNAGVPCDTLHVEDDRPYEAIIDTATKRGCDLIVMASHGRKGLSALVLGSETHKVLTHTQIPVLVCR